MCSYLLMKYGCMHNLREFADFLLKEGKNRTRGILAATRARNLFSRVKDAALFSLPS